MRILFVCDRSAGHIFPAIAMAQRISQQACGDKVYFFATSSALREHLKWEGFVVYGKPFSARNILIETAYRFFEAFYLILVIRPHKLIGFGGRDSFFLILLGSLLFLDTSIYEPNIKPGKANMVLSFFVCRVLCGFNKGKSGKKYITVGIPLRPNIKKINKKDALNILGFDARPVVFCFGGSQGSEFLNNIFIKLINSFNADYQIIHLTGERECFKISQFYNTINKKTFVKGFYYPMEVLYSAADIVICRAGASTLGEISYYKLPALLIPHPAAGGHQKANAMYFKERGAAYVFLQENFDFARFKLTTQNLLQDENLRQNIKSNLNDIKIGIGFEDFCKNNCF
ncbi:MAG: UDP-N-acetylglucosamine--N-acetylmuramyl-(pentapeptide) pyrophosphoryl-undecaprenol N-acetylglucosamine transferase [Candidatus Omnitrophota bacterium]|jgi:UDP-N-acetylglucosamine--N-acetylmuramyl-(pentapeptide) pyrophosphoryl-undecaprenol N-acetylglucosamine transferase